MGSAATMRAAVVSNRSWDFQFHLDKIEVIDMEPSRNFNPKRARGLGSSSRTRVVLGKTQSSDTATKQSLLALRYYCPNPCTEFKGFLLQTQGSGLFRWSLSTGHVCTGFARRVVDPKYGL